MASVAALHVALTLAVRVALACLAVAVHRAADTRRARALPPPLAPPAPRQRPVQEPPMTDRTV
ncbi:MAG: hypothetical protein L0H84_20920, partial [Pseudonocardia sp.]|nr:hypothetical protein [Pseudonocardia sp.]